MKAAQVVDEAIGSGSTSPNGEVESRHFQRLIAMLDEGWEVIHWQGYGARQDEMHIDIRLRRR